MKDFAAIPGNTGVFPNVESNNVTVQGAADGTPVVKAWVNELFGAFQALLSAAGLSPSGFAETATASQILAAIRRAGHYPGEIFAWGGPQTDLSVLGIRGLPLIGQGVLCASYADLVTAVYCGDGNNASAPAFFRSTTAISPYTRSPSGVYLILPNYNGRFLRALDPTGLVDIDGGAARLNGSAQSGALQNHYHDRILETNELKLRPFSYSVGGNTFEVIGTSISGADRCKTGNSSETVSNGSVTESRPSNVGVRFFIAY